MQPTLLTQSHMGLTFPTSPAERSPHPHDMPWADVVASPLSQIREQRLRKDVMGSSEVCALEPGFELGLYHVLDMQPFQATLTSVSSL